MVSSASGNSPRMTLAVVNQNITWCCSGGSPRRLAQLARARKRCHRLVRGRPSPGSDRAGPESELESSSTCPFARCRIDGPTPRYLVAGARMASRLAERMAAFLTRPAANRPPPFRTARPPSDGCARVSGLRLRDFRKPLLESVRNSGVQRCAPALQQSRIGSVPHQRMFEGIDRLRSTCSSACARTTSCARSWFEKGTGYLALLDHRRLRRREAS